MGARQIDHILGVAGHIGIAFGSQGNHPTAAGPQPVLTRCQHLFCVCCYRKSYDVAWPACAPDLARPCAVCQAYLRPVDAVVVDLCPGCASGSIDLSPAAFEQLADLSVGRIEVTWDYE